MLDELLCFASTVMGVELVYAYRWGYRDAQMPHTFKVCSPVAVDLISA